MRRWLGRVLFNLVDEEREESGWTARGFRAKLGSNPEAAVKSYDYAIGQAIFVRTDTPDYEEEGVPFKNLSELVQICSHPRPDMILEKVIVYAMPGGEPHAVTLSFLSSSKGEKPGNLDLADLEDQ